MALDQLLLTVVLVGLTGGGLAAILRTLTPARFKGRKPFSCALCMGWWCSILAMLVVDASIVELGWSTAEFFVILIAATAVAAYLNAQIIPPEIVLPGGEDEQP